MRATEKPAGLTKVITGEVQLAECHLIEAWAPSGREPKFSTVILVRKTDLRTIRAIRSAQQIALESGRDTKFGGFIPPDWTDTLRDGDFERDVEGCPKYPGHYFMTVRCATPPGIVDRTNQPVFDPVPFHAGCFARVSINAFAFNVAENAGVSFALNHVQLLRAPEEVQPEPAKAPGRHRADPDGGSAPAAEDF